MLKLSPLLRFGLPDFDAEIAFSLVFVGCFVFVLFLPNKNTK